MAIHVRESKQSSLNLCYFVNSPGYDSASCQRVATSTPRRGRACQQVRSAGGGSRVTK
ncbi:hypothetical protein GFS60_02594 [Rhodococcus sp. WAY2]|nr:hypothetical protein GFS60_02594 [Rhodococcus sp. WAY2]